MPDFLPGVPREHVLARLEASPGNELGSGKFDSPESSAALAVNCFGWFVERPATLPLIPGLEDVVWPPASVEVEDSLRFPWSGGRHPWLDASITTASHLIGVESKRCEPFRRGKVIGELSEAYWRDVWGSDMQRWTKLRDRLQAGDIRFVRLDAVQLVKHALGIFTQANKRGRLSALLYIFAEPTKVGGRQISAIEHEAHRAEIASLGDMVCGDAIQFAAISYRGWIATWPGSVMEHGQRVLDRFNP